MYVQVWLSTHTPVVGHLHIPPGVQKDEQHSAAREHGPPFDVHPVGGVGLGGGLVGGVGLGGGLEGGVGPGGFFGCQVGFGLGGGLVGGVGLGGGLVGGVGLGGGLVGGVGLLSTLHDPSSSQ